MNLSQPRMSVVVATYGRPDAVRVAVRSILASRHDSFELIVVEQNAESALGEFAGDGRLQVLMMSPGGVSAARNEGAKAARADLIAFTDDDCEVDLFWLRALEDAFHRRPEVGVILGSVLAGAHDPAVGFIPACRRLSERVQRVYTERPEVEVMGASMAVRRSVWEDGGGFWEEIGPGRTVPAAEDYDLVVRALLRGTATLECPEAAVVHHGFRTWEEGRALVAGYAFGTAFVVGYRLGTRPMDLGRCLMRFARSFLGRKSQIGAAAKHLSGSRVKPFAMGLARGLMTRWRSEVWGNSPGIPGGYAPVSPTSCPGHRDHLWRGPRASWLGVTRRWR